MVIKYNNFFFINVYSLMMAILLIKITNLTTNLFSNLITNLTTNLSPILTV